MKLPGVCVSKTKGFTFVELLLVLAIFSLLIVTSLPLAVNFYNTRQLDVQAQSLVQALRKAQFKAMNQELDSSFGVFLTYGQYVFFKGDSYLSRDYEFDEVVQLPASLSLSSSKVEIVFSRWLEGLPSATGTISLTTKNQSLSANIDINEVGLVNY